MQINVLGTQKLKANAKPTKPVFLNVYTREGGSSGVYCASTPHIDAFVAARQRHAAPGCLLKIEPTPDGNLNIEVIEEYK